MSAGVAIPAATSRAKAFVFGLAVLLGLFNLGSYAWFVHASGNFIETQLLQGVPRYRWGDTVSWEGQAPGALLGWWPAGKDGTWSIGAGSAFEVRGDPPAADLELQVLAGAHMAPGATGRMVTVLANDAEVARWRVLPGAAQVLTARIPAVAASSGRLRVEFRPELAPSPADLRQSSDYRRLGMLVKHWKLASVIEPAGPPTANKR